MTPKLHRCLAAALLAIGLLPAPAAAKDGALIYQDVCARCHGLLAEENSWQQYVPRSSSGVELAVVLPQGPTLNGIVGRPVGIIEGYQYTKGMRAFAETGAIWDLETLDKFITNSRAFVKGTTMIVKLEEERRIAVLEYLERVARYARQ